jgi:hypothetical protein
MDSIKLFFSKYFGRPVLFFRIAFVSIVVHFVIHFGYNLKGSHKKVDVIDSVSSII